MYTLLVLAASFPGLPDATAIARLPGLVRQRAAELRLVEALERRVAARRKAVAAMGANGAVEARGLDRRAAKVAALRRQAGAVGPLVRAALDGFAPHWAALGRWASRGLPHGGQ